MAEDEQFSLCWNNFNSNLSAGFHESLIRGDLVDVTLAAEGQFVKAHRLVLSVCSPYFRKMFTQMPPNQHAFVFLKDVSHSALKDLIQFMYCGEVNVKQDALPAFIGTAEALQIKGLTDGEPGPSQSPAKPSTPAPQPAPSTAAPTITSPRIRTQRSSTTRTTYKLESEDSDNDKPTQIVIHQSQGTQSQQIVQQTQKRPAQRSITPHSGSVKRVKSDPLEATDPTQITVQTVTADTKTTEAEFIDLPIELPTKAEPDYSEDAGEVEATEQDATYVEDDSYGDMKYDESYFTENDDGGGNTSGTGAATGSTTVKGQTGSFSESYVSDAGEQSATEAQDDALYRKLKKLPSVTFKRRTLPLKQTGGKINRTRKYKTEEQRFPPRCEDVQDDMGLFLPLKNETELEQLERRLNHEQFKRKFINYIKRIKDDQPLTKIFGQLLTAALASEYNLEGVKNKKPFTEFENFNECLFESYRGSSFGYAEYKKAIKKAFKDAKNRFNKAAYIERRKYGGTTLKEN